MKIFGIHWVWHLLYIAALLGMVVWGEGQLNQTALVKTELGQVQALSLPYMQRNKEAVHNSINETKMAYPSPQSERLHADARKAIGWVDSIGKKSQAVRERFNSGEKPHSINWNTSLLDDYYRLGDSLAALYGSDSVRQAWLERCLFSGYRTYPQAQFASMLAVSDTADAGRLCQNLHLNAELALIFTLQRLQKQMPVWEMRFDALLPAISAESCPRAGVPFVADIFLNAYSTQSENMTIKVNGKPMLVEAGLARYKRTYSSPGIKRLPVEIEVRNPLTGEIRTYTKEFITEVLDTTEMR
jgi:hypothetical protein